MPSTDRPAIVAPPTPVAELLTTPCGSPSYPPLKPVTVIVAVAGLMAKSAVLLLPVWSASPAKLAEAWYSRTSVGAVVEDA